MSRIDLNPAPYIRHIVLAGGRAEDILYIRKLCQQIPLYHCPWPVDNESETIKQVTYTETQPSLWAILLYNLPRIRTLDLQSRNHLRIEEAIQHAILLQNKVAFANLTTITIGRTYSLRFLHAVMTLPSMRKVSATLGDNSTSLEDIKPTSTTTRASRSSVTDLTLEDVNLSQEAIYYLLSGDPPLQHLHISIRYGGLRFSEAGLSRVLLASAAATTLLSITIRRQMNSPNDPHFSFGGFKNLSSITADWESIYPIHGSQKNSLTANLPSSLESLSITTMAFTDSLPFHLINALAEKRLCYPNWSSLSVASWLEPDAKMALENVCRQQRVEWEIKPQPHLEEGYPRSP